MNIIIITGRLPSAFWYKIYILGLKKIGNLCQKYRRKFRKIENFRPKTDFFNNMENHNYEHIAARKQRPRAFKARFLPQMLLKNKFWTLGAKTIPKTAICLVF